MDNGNLEAQQKTYAIVQRKSQEIAAIKMQRNIIISRMIVGWYKAWWDFEVENCKVAIK